jgi:hypothetical protein
MNFEENMTGIEETNRGRVFIPPPNKICFTKVNIISYRSNKNAFSD